MIEVLKIVEQMVKNDAELKTLFNAEDNRQFFYIGVSPYDVNFPVLIMDFRHINTRHPVVDELEINFDIFDRDVSLFRVMSIVSRIEKLLLNFSPQNEEEKRILSIKRNYGSLVPDSNTEIQHYVLNFTIYFSRNDLV